MRVLYRLSSLILAGVLLLAACAPSSAQAPSTQVLTVETFLADITQRIAGDRVQVDALVPLGVDPHSFEPSPRDVAKISSSTILIANGSGFEEWLEETLRNAGGERTYIEASAGLKSRDPGSGEPVDEGQDAHEAVDPHYWLDPNQTIHYVENIRDGLSQADPEGAEIYAANADAYIQELRDLDEWTRAKVEEIPADQRKFVTNHESFGYFADQYGFQVVGTILTSSSSTAAPSAQEMAQLIEQIRASGVKAIFLETGANPQLAEQIGAETGVKVVEGLFTHSLSEPEGPAPTYIDMIRYNVEAIVSALK